MVIKHDGVEHAGYLAYIGLLALFPFLVLIVALAGFLGQGELGSNFILLLVNHLPPDAFDSLKPRIAEIMEGPPKGLVTVSILGAIWTSSSLLEGMRTVLNRAYHVATPPAYWFRRLMSVLQLLLLTFLIIVAMIMIVIAPLVTRKIGEMIRYSLPLEDEVNLIELFLTSSVFILFVVVSTIYYILPNIKLRIRNVVPGAIFTVGGWTLAGTAFSSFLAHSNQTLIYGSLGGIIATIVFFFVINIILIFGAELNYQISTAFGVRLEKKEPTIEKDPEEDDSLPSGT